MAQNPKPEEVIFGPDFHVYGGWGPDQFSRPFLFSWLSTMHFYGGNWRGNSQIKVFMKGPMNNPAFPPTQKQILTLFTDVSGSITGSVENTSPTYMIPYDSGIRGNLGTNMPNIPIPGHYQIIGVLDDPIIPEIAFINGGIELLPQTVPDANINWGLSRGQRFGFLDSHSPEYLDPEWTSVWSRHPVQVYGTVAETNDDPNNQPNLMAHHETPSSHYAHDGNMMLLPDNDYRWVLGTANLAGSASDKETGKIEVEWEMQNNYSPNTYQSGPVGMPLWVHGTAGDRVFAVGGWVMDGGHRGSGFRTEIHPPRLLATMRKTPTVVPFDKPECLIPALQVDVYASGHGGGVSQALYEGLEDLLHNSGKGGGRLEDFIAIEYGSRPVYDVYYRYGPGSDSLLDSILFIYGLVGGPDVYDHAGPSSVGTDVNTGLPTTWDYSQDPPANILPWALGPEERPINDMDYDFDVFLPPPPPGATQPRVTVETHGEHTTAVNEVITFTEPDNDTGLPTKAHVHLPYKNADSGIYARTYKFSWNAYSWPGRKYTLKVNDITFFDPDESIIENWNNFTGKTVLWGELNGQWKSLTDAAPDQMLSGVLQKHVRFGDAAPTFDVYLKNSDKMRFYTYGYERCSLENKFVVDIGKGAYEAAKSIVDELLIRSGDNKKRGGALFKAAPIPLGVPSGVIGNHIEQAGYTIDDFETYSSAYYVGFTISFAGNPHADISPTTLDFGDVALNGTVDRTVKIKNLAELFANGGFPFSNIDDLNCTFSLTGDGFTLEPNTATSTLPGGFSQDLTVRFHPTGPGQGSGSLVITTNDGCTTSLTIPLTAKVLFPEIGVVPPGDIPITVVGCTSSKTVSISNNGGSDLVFTPSMTGSGYSLSPYTANAQGQITVTAGSSTTLTVNFAPTAVSRSAKGTLTLTSNDPFNPTKAIDFCTEAVRAGIRVLVVKADGTPYAKVDQITITSNSSPPVSINNKDMLLGTVAPPASCQTFMYHFERSLTPTKPSGPPGSRYTLKVKIGNMSKSLDFTLGTCEFKNLFIRLP